MSVSKYCKYSPYIVLAIPFFISTGLWMLIRWRQVLYSFSVALMGELAGVLAFSYMFLSIILSTRAKAFDKAMCGIDKAYRIHSFAGQISMIAVSLHPIMLLPRYASDIFGYWKFLSISGWISKDIGVVSIYIFIAGIVATLYLKLPYEKWKFLHKAMFLVFVLSAIHSFLSTTLPEPMKIYIGTLSAIGIPAGAYSISREYFHGSKMKVESVRRFGNITEIEFSRTIKFVPGQFVFVKFLKKGLDEFHPFSIISSPGEKLKIAVKSLGDFTMRVSAVEKGDSAIVDGPYGGFTIDRGGEKQLWIAGGIGVTPFVSLSSVSKGRDIIMLYSARKKDEFMYSDILGKRIKLILFESSKNGRLDAEKVKSLVKDVDKRTVFICGPEGLRKEMVNGLGKFGVKEFVYEEFRMR